MFIQCEKYSYPFSISFKAVIYSRHICLEKIRREVIRNPPEQKTMIHMLGFNNNNVSWEPEGRYHYSKMFRWESEGRYRHRTYLLR